VYRRERDFIVCFISSDIVGLNVAEKMKHFKNIKHIIQNISLCCKHYVSNFFFFCRDRSTELISTIENLQLNNKRLVEQHSAMQAQVCRVICIYTASNRFFFFKCTFSRPFLTFD